MINTDVKRILFIDMNTEKLRIVKRSDLNKYLGGVGVAIKLFQENFHPELPPLHTGKLGESYAGGRLAFVMLHAGYDAIVITGKALKPRYISIGSSVVKFKDARAIWALAATKQAVW